MRVGKEKGKEKEGEGKVLRWGKEKRRRKERGG